MRREPRLVGGGDWQLVPVHGLAKRGVDTQFWVMFTELEQRWGAQGAPNRTLPSSRKFYLNVNFFMFFFLSFNRL